MGLNADREPRVATPGWRGEVALSPGRVAYSGTISSADMHSHAAIQIYLCETGQVHLAGESGPEATSTSAVIPAGAKHAVRADPGTSGTTVFIDPSSTWAPQIDGSTVGPPGWVERGQDDAVRNLVLAALSTPQPAAATFGDRVERWVRSRLPDAVAVTDLAESLAISPATLRRRSTAELGLGVQAYVRWVRLIVALEQVALGATITDAAAAAGFADGSHATRACREMFGLAPSDAIAQLTLH